MSEGWVIPGSPLAFPLPTPDGPFLPSKEYKYSTGTCILDFTYAQAQGALVRHPLERAQCTEGLVGSYR